MYLYKKTSNNTLKALFLLGITLLGAGAKPAFAINYESLERIYGEKFTMSATGTPLKESEAPMSIEIISQEEIRRSGALDIPQLLQHVAGVDVRRDSIGSVDVGMRGYNRAKTNKVLILINGRQIFENSFNLMAWNLIPIQMSEIEQIEIVKGPNSALFGFNATFGAINIITYNPLDRDINQAQVRIGNLEHREASIVDTVHFNDQSAVRLSASHAISDDFNRDSITGQPKASSNASFKNSAAFDYELEPSKKDNLRIQGQHSVGNFYYYSTATSLEFIGTFLQVNYQKQSSLGLWDIMAYRNDYQLNSVSRKSLLNLIKVDNLNSIGANHSLRLSAEYREGSGNGESFGSKMKHKLYSPSAVWSWQATDKLSFINSVRYDYLSQERDTAPTIAPYTLDDYERTVEETSFNSSALYKINTQERVHASIGRSLFLPPDLDRGADANIYGGSIQVIGDPTLQTQRNLAAEIGYARDFPTLKSTAKITAYWQKVTNIVDVNFVGSSPVIATWEDFGDSQSRGIELEYEAKPSPEFNWGANYSYNLVNDDDEDTKLNNEGDYPKHTASLYGSYTPNETWEFNTDLNFVGDTRQNQNSFNGDFGEDIDAYFVLNGRIGYNINPSTSLSLDGYNLIDKHRERSTRSTTGTTSGHGVVMGKSLILTLSHNY